MKPLGIFVAIIAAVCLGVTCASNQLSPPRGAENSVVVISAEIELDKVISPFLLRVQGATFGSHAPAPTPAPKTEIHCGTGFALGGYIYTCNHVILGAKLITVGLRNGKSQQAKLLRTDPPSDLAELEIAEMPPSLVLRSYPPRVLERVWQIGNPGELRFVSASGYFATFAGGENRFIIDTWFGNSGSPILDQSGRVVGMCHDIIKGSRITGGGTLQELYNFTHPDSPR